MGAVTLMAVGARHLRLHGVGVGSRGRLVVPDEIDLGLIRADRDPQATGPLGRVGPDGLPGAGLPSGVADGEVVAGGVVAEGPGEAAGRNGLGDHAVHGLVGHLVIMTVEERGHAVRLHHLPDGEASPDGRVPVGAPCVGGAVDVVAAPLHEVGGVHAAVSVVDLVDGRRHAVAADDLVGEDELVLGVAAREGRLEPVELVGPQGPVPTIAGARCVCLPASRGSGVRLGRRRPEGTDDDEERIAPGPGVVVLLQMVSAQVGHRARVAAVEAVGNRVHKELLLGVLAHDRQAVGQGALQVPGFLLLVVAGHQEDRR